MSKGIKISEKHGVNPTIPICFWCGEHKNQVALLGKLKGDIEAPKNAVIDYEPCDKCQENMDKGITFMEASETPTENGQPEMQKGVYPTGSWSVVKESALDDIFDRESVENILKVKKAFVDKEMYTKMFVE